ncbi:MAG: iron-sulfur cluster assembly protein [Kiritimatiellia bacterium]|jgi:iron-sulfur cluster assembly protein
MAITITERAKEELKQMNLSNGKVLRMSVVPGGCSGMTYKADIDDDRQPEDEVLFEDQEITIVSREGTDLFLDGLTIDFSDDLIRRGFRFSNPNASGSCGCGSSFSS